MKQLVAIAIRRDGSSGGFINIAVLNGHSNYDDEMRSQEHIRQDSPDFPKVDVLAPTYSDWDEDHKRLMAKD